MIDGRCWGQIARLGGCVWGWGCSQLVRREGSRCAAGTRGPGLPFHSLLRLLPLPHGSRIALVPLRTAASSASSIWAVQATSPAQPYPGSFCDGGGGVARSESMTPPPSSMAQPWRLPGRRREEQTRVRPSRQPQTCRRGHVSRRPASCGDPPRPAALSLARGHSGQELGSPL